MKKLSFIVVFMLGCMVMAAAQTSAKVEFDDNSNKVIAKVSDGRSVEVRATPWTYVDRAGVEFPIYMSGSGSCFVEKVSKKTGKTYRYYLGKDTSIELCKRLGVEYKGK